MGFKYDPTLDHTFRRLNKLGRFFLGQTSPSGTVGAAFHMANEFFLLIHAVEASMAVRQAFV